MEYHYTTNQLGISDEGIHFLRNRFEYKKIPFSQIEKVELKKGMQLNNWYVIFFVGVALLSTGIYLGLGIFNALQNPGHNLRSLRIVYLLFIPIVGGYFVYESLQYGLILELKYNREKKKCFHLKRLTPESRQKFSEFMKAKMGNKFINQLAPVQVRFS